MSQNSDNFCLFFLQTWTFIEELSVCIGIRIRRSFFDAWLKKIKLWLKLLFLNVALLFVTKRHLSKTFSLILACLTWIDRTFLSFSFLSKRRKNNWQVGLLTTSPSDYIEISHLVEESYQVSS